VKIKMRANFYLLTTRGESCNVCEKPIQEVGYLAIINGKNNLSNNPIRICKDCSKELYDLSRLIKKKKEVKK